MELEIQESYSEVYEIISLMPEEYKRKIPKKVIAFFKNNRRLDYKVNIDKNNLFDKSKLKAKTLTIIAMLNIKYWCPNEKIKKQLVEQYNKNENAHQKELEEKYNLDNIFKNRNSISTPIVDNMQLTVYKKQKWYQKILKNILNIFKRKN